MEYNLYVNVDQLIFVSIIQQELKMIQTLQFNGEDQDFGV